jgi:hypothetical protein
MVDSKSDFFIVLPSNSNLKSHPSNTPGEYTVRLGRPVTLSGDWEVALLNIQYPHNWFDISEKAVVHWVYTKNRVPARDEVVASKVKVVHNEIFQTNTVSLVDPEMFAANDMRYTSHTVWPGHFSSAQEIGDRMCKLIEDGIKNSDLRRHPKIVFQFDFHTRSGAVHASEGSLFLFTESVYLANMLGINTIEVTPAQTDEISSIELPKLYMLSGPGKSLFSKLDSIYVYSDIVENQFVGDTEAPLLGIVPIQKRTDDKQFFTFNPPLYLPVNKSHFSEVKILLRTSKKEKLPFPIFTPNVVCTLRFRRHKSNL